MPTYDAFISYSHAKDKPLAAALQSVVQRLGKPWYRRRALRVFRDDTSLSATPHLWPSIEEALGQCHFLILFASPEAAQSRWVAKEVVYWLKHKNIESFLIALTGGELSWDEDARDFRWNETTPLPTALKNQFSAEPKWVDLRPYRDGANPRDHKFIELGADFAATVRGIPKEDLLSQEVRQQRRALSLAWSAAGSLLVLVGAAAWQWSEAVAQRDRAERTLTAVEAAGRTASSLVSDVAHRFRGDTGIPQSLLAAVTDRARALAEDLNRAGEIQTKLSEPRGYAWVQLASTLNALGDTRHALEAATEAKSIFEGLVAADRTRAVWQTGLSVSYDRLGDVLFDLGNQAEALAAYRRGLEIIRRLGRQAGDGGNAEHNIAVAHEKIGAALAALGQKADALQWHRESLELRSALIADYPANSEYLRALAIGHQILGGMLSSDGEENGALAAFRRSVTIAEQLARREPDTVERQRDLVTAYDQLGDFLRERRPTEALEVFHDALKSMRQLSNQHPDRVDWQRAVALINQKIAELLQDSGQLSEALAAYRESLTIRKKLLSPKSMPSSWAGELAKNYQRMSDILADEGKPTEALALAQARTDLIREIEYGSNPRQTHAEALGNLGWYALLAHSFDKALAASDEAVELAPSLLWLRANQAHALMFSGATEAARAQYLAHRGEIIDQRLSRTWEASVTSDFGIFRRTGLTSPLMAEVETLFSR